MFYCLPVIGRGHCVQKERPRGKIDDRRADDAHRIKFWRAAKIGLGYWRRHIALPDNAAIHSVQRVNIIRLRRYNDHWAVWTAFDVKRLGVNGAHDRTVEV